MLDHRACIAAPARAETVVACMLLGACFRLLRMATPTAFFTTRAGTQVGLACGVLFLRCNLFLRFFSTPPTPFLLCAELERTAKGALRVMVFRTQDGRVFSELLDFYQSLPHNKCIFT